MPHELLFRAIDAQFAQYTMQIDEQLFSFLTEQITSYVQTCINEEFNGTEDFKDKISYLNGLKEGLSRKIKTLREIMVVKDAKFKELVPKEEHKEEMETKKVSFIEDEITEEICISDIDLNKMI